MPAGRTAARDYADPAPRRCGFRVGKSRPIGRRCARPKRQERKYGCEPKATTWLGLPLWKRPLKEIALDRLFASVDRFLYIGSANKRLYQRYGISDARLYSAPYAVDNERFTRQARELRPQRTELRRRWGISDDAFCMLFCGKFIKKKRPLDLVDAARSLHTDGRLRNIHLLFVGSGELDRELRQACHVMYDAETADRLGPTPVNSCTAPVAAPPASFAGFLIRQISRAYVAADCLVLPSDHGVDLGACGK